MDENGKNLSIFVERGMMRFSVSRDSQIRNGGFKMTELENPKITAGF